MKSGCIFAIIELNLIYLEVTSGHVLDMNTVIEWQALFHITLLLIFTLNIK